MEEQWIIAVHGDGSDNRINGNTIAEASTYSLIVGFFFGMFQWIRKKIRNRGRDLAAEKEAARINKTAIALQAKLSEYVDGNTDPELIDELIETLEELQAYNQSGKLVFIHPEELTRVRESIAGETVEGTDELSLIRELLIRQRETTGK